MRPEHWFRLATCCETRLCATPCLMNIALRCWCHASVSTHARTSFARLLICRAVSRKFNFRVGSTWQCQGSDRELWRDVRASSAAGKMGKSKAGEDEEAGCMEADIHLHPLRSTPQRWPWTDFRYLSLSSYRCGAAIGAASRAASPISSTSVC